MAKTELDPELADLIGVPEAAPAAQPAAGDGSPSFNSLFGSGPGEDESNGAGTLDVAARLPIITKFEQQPRALFDKEYYKKLLTGEGEQATRVHKILSAFLTSKDPKERSANRERLIPAYWDLAGGIARRIGGDLSEQKQMLLRFAALSPTLISAGQRDMFSRVIAERGHPEPVVYLDEWLLSVAGGKVKPSAVDEVQAAKKGEDSRAGEMLEKRQGQYESALSQLDLALGKLDDLERQLQEQARIITDHGLRTDFDGRKDAFTSGQKSALSELTAILRQLGTLDKELTKGYGQLERLRDEVEELRSKGGGAAEASAVSAEVVVEELMTVRQMAKMCIGRQGNHFPILYKQYLRENIAEIATRENVLAIMADIESIDPQIFHRTFKGQTNRIVPNVILIPCYGDTGVCWEPFERFNRASSRGRVGIPMYPKDLRAAVTMAMADLRWQVAKEKAQHYWMEEGLTGWYYQRFQARKLKGDVRDAFLQDYILWITREKDGTQKLDKEVRGIFWRLMPFPQHIKDDLKKRGFAYAELAKKDANRALSDGY